jgi:hypothetical protein
MSGIGMIQKRLEDRIAKQSQVSESSGKEIWLKDGDQLFMKAIATGDENDIYLHEFHIYEFQQGADKGWRSVLVIDGEPVDAVPSEAMYWDDQPDKRKLPRHKFALWGYVTEILHPNKRDESWDEITSRSGVKMYRESVNDFKVLTLSFGARNTNFYQFSDIYDENGSLNKNIIRIKRRGSNLDTTYTITTTKEVIDIPENKASEIKNLTPMSEYVEQRYGKSTSDTSVPDNAVSTEDDDDDMPF